jgi:hypothetical protein
MRSITSAALILFFSVVAAPGQSGQWGSRGISRRFVVQGNLVIAADGRGVAVYDVSDAANIRRLSVAETETESIDVAVLNGTDVIVAARGRLGRFSLSPNGTLTPAGSIATTASILASNGHSLAGATTSEIVVWQPTEDGLVSVARFTTMAPIGSLAWHGDTLLAAVPGIGIWFFDPSGARQPQVIPENAHDLAVDGDTLYIAAGGSGLAIYDLHDESAPRFLGRVSGELNLTRIAASGGRAYAIQPSDMVDVFDVTLPTTPVLAATIRQPAAVIAASDARLYVAGSIVDRGLTTEMGVPLRIYDASDSAAPRAIGEFDDLAGPVSGIATDGTLAYVVDHPYFRVLDVSSTAAPHELSSIRLDNLGDRVRLLGKQLIIYGRGDVQLLDVSNPYAPRLMKVWHSQGSPPSNAAFARTTILEGNPFSGLHVVDFTNFPDPTQIGGIKNHYFEVVANGADVAYVCYQGDELVTVDLSDPRAPYFVWSTPLAMVRAEIVPATESRPSLLLALGLDGMHIYSLADPLRPVETAIVPMPSDAIFAANSTTAWVALDGTISTLDLSDSGHSSLTPTAMRAVAPMQLAATDGGKLVVADRYSVRVYGPDTAPPPSPRRRPSHP